jgi:hypothetical protein
MKDLRPAARRFRPEDVADPDRHVIRQLRTTFGPNDLLQPALELGPPEARATVAEMLGKTHGPVRLELAVEIALDISQHFAAANL